MGLWIRAEQEKDERVEIKMPYSNFNQVIIDICAEIAADAVAFDVDKYRHGTARELLSKRYIGDSFDIIHGIAEWLDTEGKLSCTECQEIVKRTKGILFTNGDTKSFLEVIKFCADNEVSCLWD